MQYKDYHAAIHFSSEDEIFYGKIAGINDLISFEGESVKELKKAFHEAVDDYLETCKRQKKNPDKPFKGSFNIRIPPDLHRRAAMLAAITHVSLNDFVRYSIYYVLSHKEATKELKAELEKESQ
jgi:predicted HicB family RNase H-like nuclease